MFSSRAFLEVMKEYDFLSFPRAIGNPYQGVAFNSHNFWHFVKTNNANKICFTSHNAYPEWDGTQDPRLVRLGKFFFDFDHKTKPENALRDVRRLASFLDEQNMPWGATFSGSKGYHLYLFTERENLEINDKLWNRIIAIHSWLRYKGDRSRIPVYNRDGSSKTTGRPWIRTLDSKVAEPKRLCRIPFTRHVGMGDERQYKVSDKYCIPIKPDELFSLEHEDIIDMSKAPVIRKGYIQSGEKRNLTAFLDELDINVKYWSNVSMDEGITKTGAFVPALYNGVPEDDYAVYISKIIPRPCIHGDLFTENPTHKSRFLAVVQMKSIGMTYEEVVEVFDNMADKFNWADRRHRGTLLYQVRQIYFRRTSAGGYWHASCTKIKNRYHLCVGDKCERWFKLEGEKDE